MDEDAAELRIVCAALLRLLCINSLGDICNTPAIEGGNNEVTCESMVKPYKIDMVLPDQREFSNNHY